MNICRANVTDKKTDKKGVVRLLMARGTVGRVLRRQGLSKAAKVELDGVVSGWRDVDGLGNRERQSMYTAQVRRHPKVILAFIMKSSIFNKLRHCMRASVVFLTSFRMIPLADGVRQSP